MLNACSANVVVVNIDSGFKAGYVAALIARRAAGAQFTARSASEAEDNPR
jgi:NCAIR mutase (PurE)-related protein